MTDTGVEHGIDVEEVLTHYVLAALWSTNDESDPSGGDPLDANYEDVDIHPGTLAEMRRDVEEFVTANHVDLLRWPGCHSDEGTSVEEQSGHDFWLTRNRHGVGFWEPEWPEPHGPRLDEAAIAFGEYHLYVGDDGVIHGTGD